MFGLKQQIVSGYRFGDKVSYSANRHTGTDFKCNYEPLYAMFDGIVTKGFTAGGGNYTTLVRPNGDTITSRHLSKVLKIGQVKEGDQIAITGGRKGDPTSGTFSDSPHEHREVKINGKLTDPEKYNWKTMVKLPITLVANKNMWSTLQDQLIKIQEWISNYSAGKLQVMFDVKHTDFLEVPKMPWQGTKCVDVGWYREQITHLATGKATLLLLNPEQWGISGWGTMTYGDPGKPVRMEVMAIENEMNGPTTILVPRVFHEICHMLFFLTGQPDRTHEFLLTDVDRKAELLALIDYGKLEVALNNIKPVEKIQIRYIGWTDQEKGIYFPFDSIERMKKVLDKLETDYPDYDFNPKEINLGKRPF